MQVNRLKFLILFWLIPTIAGCNFPLLDSNVKRAPVARIEFAIINQSWLAESMVEINWRVTGAGVQPVLIGLNQNGKLIETIASVDANANNANWAPPIHLLEGSYMVAGEIEGRVVSQKGKPVDLRAQTPWQSHVISSFGNGPDGVRLADVNGDTLLDIATSFESSGEVALFQHPGYGNEDSPWTSVIVGNVPRGEDALAIDLDGDGVQDIVSSHEGDTLGIYVHWAPANREDYLNAAAWQTELIPESQGRGWMFAISMDVNQDGILDIVAGSKDDYFNDRNSVGDLGWFEAPRENRRNLDEWRYQSIDHTGWPMSIIAHDLDDDGDLDLLVTDRDSDDEHQGARWLENPGPPWEDEWSSHFLADLAGTSPVFMAMGDFDLDGSLEFVVPLLDENSLVILKREVVDGETIFSSYPVFFGTSSGLGSLKAVETGDVDNDGSLDIVVSYVGGRIGVIWLKYLETPFDGPWEVHIVSSLRDAKFDLVELYDVDGDGDKDILTTEEVHNLGVVWFENPLVP